MALLKSTNLPGLTYIEYRDNLYYNKYRYRVSITVSGLRRGYYFHPDEFIERLKENQLWGRIGSEEKKIITTNLPQITHLLQFRTDNKKNKELTVRIEGNSMSVFHNDLDYLHKQFDSIQFDNITYTQAETAGFSGVKTFVKEPKHKYRVYLRSKRIGDEFRTKLEEFLKNNKKLYPSNALRIWVHPNSKNQRFWYSNWTSSNHFIDYDDESYLTYMALMYGDYLGKKYKLEKRADTV